MVLHCVSKMSPDFFLGLLSQLGGYEGITKVRIKMCEQCTNCENFPDGRRVITNEQELYSWKGEDSRNLWTFTKWDFVEELYIEWEGKSLKVVDCFTTLNFTGFTYLDVDFKSLPGQGAQKVILNF